MRTQTLAIVLTLATWPVSSAAQTPPPAAALPEITQTGVPQRPNPTPPPPGQRSAPPAAGPAQAAPPGTSTWQNVKLDVTISDSLSAETQSRKVVSMLIVDGRSGQVRSAGGDGLINIDARPTVRQDGRIFLQLTVEYRPELTAQQAQQSGSSRVTLFSESLALLVLDGKPVVASQSADPRSDRKVAIEVMATIVK